MRKIHNVNRATGFRLKKKSNFIFTKNLVNAKHNIYLKEKKSKYEKHIIHIHVYVSFKYVCYKYDKRQKKNSSYSPYQTAPPPVLSPRSPWLGGILQWLSSSSCKCRLGCTLVYTSECMPPVLIGRVQWWLSAHRSKLCMEINRRLKNYSAFIYLLQNFFPKQEMF